ncbi:hypothetical protein [Moritella sp. Urea-trap-13]|uniref:hypothetical protein n=1 Tax=Moritella sp. Urea-trap-13 TaxID=2058327 RepID=UPI000C31F186|nr:hypothetical protein [Moritella sp. Urea-trap-13]PKH05308.1 hypothetical protein CXF93_18655 [Moritella sp. Urea-trap-13]
MIDIVLSILVFFLISISQVIEMHAYTLKGVHSEIYARQFLGLANWMQYLARIIYVFVLMLLSFMFEFLNLGDGILPLVMGAFVFSFILSILFFTYQSFRDKIVFLLRPVAAFSYPELKNMKINVTINDASFDRVFFYTVFSTWLIGLAFILPFFIAIRYPEFRMMATYTGQALNFVATAVIFSRIEPKIFQELDQTVFSGDNVCSSIQSLLKARMYAQLFIVTTIFLMMML